MSLPARKQPGAARRRKKAAHLRRVKERLLGRRPSTTTAWAADDLVGTPILADVKRMIDLLEKDKEEGAP